jgi:putative ABC transport system ATP-binding protein
VARFDGNGRAEMASRCCAFLADNIERPKLAPMLELRALTKSVPGGRVLFRDLSLSVAPGELVAIIAQHRSGA